jgi:hypothetical protein
MDINKFDVIVWVRKTDSFPTLCDELLRLAGNEPDESTSFEGMVDFHWGFVDLVAATLQLRQPRCVGYVQGRAIHAALGHANFMQERALVRPCLKQNRPQRSMPLRLRQEVPEMLR